MEQKQRLYVHDSIILQDDGEEVHEVSLNTRGETPANSREALYEAVYNEGVDPAELYEYEDSDIATVWFSKDGEVEKIELDEWVIDEFGF